MLFKLHFLGAFDDWQLPLWTSWDNSHNLHNFWWMCDFLFMQKISSLGVVFNVWSLITSTNILCPLMIWEGKTTFISKKVVMIWVIMKKTKVCVQIQLFLTFFTFNDLKHHLRYESYSLCFFCISYEYICRLFFT